MLSVKGGLFCLYLTVFQYIQRVYLMLNGAQLALFAEEQ